LFAWSARAENPPPHDTLQNPFSLGTVLLFGLLLAAVTLAAKLAETEFHGAGLLPLAAITGATDVDPVTLSMADLARTGAGPALAAAAILVATAANLVVRATLPVTIGGVRYGWPLTVVAL